MDELKKNYMNVIRQILITSLPLLICALIPLLWMIYYYFNEGTLQKDLNFILTDFPLHTLYDSPPFIIISIYAYCLIRKERGNKEIAIRLSSILLPIAVFSFYWYAACFPDPLALGFLPFINLLILVPAWIVSIVVNNAFKSTRNE